FYTQYKQKPVGEYHVGVCINTLCAIMGGDQIWDELSEHTGLGNDETTPDGKVSIERIECNAACDFAPVMMVNWEFFDNMTPEKAKKLADARGGGRPVRPTRGPGHLARGREASRTRAGFPAGGAGEGVRAGPGSLRGLERARERGWEAPPADVDRERPDEPVRPEQISPPPHEPGKPIPGEAKPGSQEGRSK